VATTSGLGADSCDTPGTRKDQERRGEAAKSIRRVIRARLGTARSARISSSTAAEVGRRGRREILPGASSAEVLLFFLRVAGAGLAAGEVGPHPGLLGSSSSPRASQGMKPAVSARVQRSSPSVRTPTAARAGCGAREEPRLDRPTGTPGRSRPPPNPTAPRAEQHYRAVVLRSACKARSMSPRTSDIKPGQLRRPRRAPLFIAHSLERLRLFGAVRPGHLAFTVPGKAVDEAVAQDAASQARMLAPGRNVSRALRGAQYVSAPGRARRLAAREPERRDGRCCRSMAAPLSRRPCDRSSTRRLYRQLLSFQG